MALIAVQYPETQRLRAVTNAHWIVGWFLLIILLMLPAAASAHPLGNFTVNHYSRLEVASDQVRIFYVLDLAEISAFQAIQVIDGDKDGKVSDAESYAYARSKRDEIIKGLRLSFDDVPVTLQADEPELSFPPGQGGLSLLRLTFWLNGDLPTTSQQAIVARFENTNEIDRLGWREIVVRGVNGLQISDSSTSDRDVSDELRIYPVDMLTSPLRQTSASFSFRGASGSTRQPVQTPQQLGAATNDGAFAALITTSTLDPSVVLLALATALGLGALHALEPGHGKTVAAAYLIGSRATPWHAVLLGLTVTTVHTASVFLLGIVTLFLSDIILPERLLPWLGLGSGLIVVLMGLQMVLSTMRRLPASAIQAHGHGAFGVHSHEPGQPHGHSHQLPGDKLSWKGVLAIGVSGGLLPCPAALVVLLSAIGLGRIGFGMLLIVAFSAGLALVLSAIGLLTLYGRRGLSRLQLGSRAVTIAPVLGQFVDILPVIGGFLVIGAGTLLLYHSLPLISLWQL